jgi:hypothetical protein
MVDALRSVDLMRPRRSTVPLNAAAPSPSAAPAAAAALSVDEATRDIEDLGWRECPVSSLLSVHAGVRSLDDAAAATPVPISVVAPGSTERISPPSLLRSAIAPGSTERISPPSLLSASSPPPPPPVPPTAARKKRPLMGMGKAATKVRRRRMVELLTLPSVEMATSA